MLEHIDYIIMMQAYNVTLVFSQDYSITVFILAQTYYSSDTTVKLVMLSFLATSQCLFVCLTVHGI